MAVEVHSGRSNKEPEICLTACRSHLLHRDASRPTETLVLYGYSNSDPEYRANLAFFVRHGMWEGDGCNYIIVVPKVKTLGKGPEKGLPCLLEHP